MAEPDQPPRFNLRLTPQIDRLLMQRIRKTGRSKNAEILRALEWHLQPNPARQIVDAIHPLIDELSEEEQAQFVGLVQAMRRAALAKSRR